MRQRHLPRQGYSQKNLLLSLHRNGEGNVSKMVGDASHLFIPHKDALYRVESENSHVPSYVVQIQISQDDDVLNILNTVITRELHFSNHDFECASRLFAILDTDSINLLDRNVVKEFVHKRCPVFSKRDEDLIRLQLHTRTNDCGKTLHEIHQSPTFDEVWKSVVACSRFAPTGGPEDAICLGIEGWLVFCRFIALAQYLEAKRRFSARHLQQTMRQRNSPHGSEVVVVDVPPPEPPALISPSQLAKYENRNGNGLPLPELDLDHSLLAAHDLTARRRPSFQEMRDIGEVKLSLFGYSKSASIPQSALSSSLEFAIAYKRRSLRGSSSLCQDDGIVRRSMADLKWLDDTFTSHRVLGGTLCGRILPPFPPTTSSCVGVLSSHFPSDESSFNAKSIKKSTGGALYAAAAGVGRIRDAAKSLINPLGSYLNGPPTDKRSDEALISSASQTLAHSKKMAMKKRSTNLSLPENYYNPSSPMGKARQLERYLNYLLEHPALSTSFPLNAVLTASQCGLEAARETLDECIRESKELKEQASHIDDGKFGNSLSPNFTWVRTMAQAAMALQVHGMLETSGMQSASARLQHASLPAFGPSVRSSGWDEVDVVSADIRDCLTSNRNVPNAQEVHSFEDGVVNDDGYDLLPFPVPAPERRILTVGNAPNNTANESSGEERYHYGSGNLENRYPLHIEDDGGSAFLGDIAVDENIDKLREVIGSVENTLSRCLVSSGGIGKAHRERLNLHLTVIRGLDSWDGMRGRFICQRSLMKGVAGVDQSKELYEESDLALIDDLSWQTSLAGSAVTAAEDVRAAVRVSRTASNARAAASAAAFSAQTACERGEFATLDEARGAQTRASIAQSHAIHAAVVEHEAKTVKRRATLALANDVKTWNIHRKREMLRSCIVYARSQHEAARRSVDAWSTLRDGFIGAPMNPSKVERKPAVQKPSVEPGEVTAKICNSSPTIVAVDHNILTKTESPDFFALPVIQQEVTSEISKSTEMVEHCLELPFAEAAPVDACDILNTMLSFDNNHEDVTVGGSYNNNERESSFTEDKMSESMQSIVNGIINSWGVDLESDDDHLALPVGMAASILLEEGRHALANTKSFNIV